MKNGWSYRQYAFFRLCLGLYLLVHFLYLLPYGAELFSYQGILSDAFVSPFIKAFPNIFLWSDAPLAVFIVLSLGTIGSICLIFNKFSKFASFGLWLILTSLFGRNPLIANPSLPFIGWILLTQLFVPPKPKNPFDPWCFPKEIFALAWIVMAIGYSYSGFTKLTSPSWLDGSALYAVLSSALARDNFLVNLSLQYPLFLTCLSFFTLALELFFAPLACFKKLRPYIWLLMLSMHTGLVFFLRFIDLSMGMIILQLFTFDPAWIPAKKDSSLKVFYDGSCGLCHRFVQLILQEMPQNETLFSFSPLEGDQKSIVVLDIESQTYFYKTKAVSLILSRLGGLFRLLSLLLSILPFTDFFYDLIARLRHRFFPKPNATCPLVPSHLQSFF